MYVRSTVKTKFLTQLRIFVEILDVTCNLRVSFNRPHNRGGPGQGLLFVGFYKMISGKTIAWDPLSLFSRDILSFSYYLQKHNSTVAKISECLTKSQHLIKI